MFKDHYEAGLWPPAGDAQHCPPLRGERAAAVPPRQILAVAPALVGQVRASASRTSYGESRRFIRRDIRGVGEHAPVLPGARATLRGKPAGL